MDGFILTHAYERVDIPTQEQVDAFLPPFEPRQVLDPREPVSIGAMVGPEAFTEVRYLAHHKQMRALDADPAAVAPSSRQQFGRDSGGLIRAYRTEDAETIVVALGSVNGTIKDVIDEHARRRRADRLGVDLLVPPVPARRRCATRCSTPSASWCSRSASPWASAASSPTACARRCPASSCKATR